MLRDPPQWLRANRALTNAWKHVGNVDHRNPVALLVNLKLLFYHVNDWGNGVVLEHSSTLLDRRVHHRQFIA